MVLLPTSSLLELQQVHMVLLVNFPANGSGQAAVTVPYTIADGSTSLNDVLKGIVALIA
jgi:hypothetical protein